MKLCLINNNFRYELEKLVRIFLPFEKIEFSNTRSSEGGTAVAELINGKTAAAELFLGGKHYSRTAEIPVASEKECELKLATALYFCFVDATGYEPAWGLLTGVRPAKLFSRLAREHGRDAACEYFKNTLMVKEQKLSLCEEAFAGEDKIISLSGGKSYSLYISIPFCPTRCSYCSFVSHSVEKAKKLIEPYTELLCRELEETAAIAEKNGLKLETVYIGGGTPTAISASQLEKIMLTVKKSFDLSRIREYTVEAGRPDTVTAEKLSVIKNGGATRISINPQSMNDGVLEAIGRKHSADDTRKAFRLARESGFCNINADLIAGLPTDTLNGFKQTVEDVIALEPESVTVHSLSVKRSSRLNVSGELPEAEVGKIASDMVDFARERLSGEGILPYYMYRQSKTVGNLENVGYAKNGFECLYNVYIMDETHSVLACGASAVTKLREPGGDYIERIFNFKYPYEYISRFDELIERKKGIDGFYGKFGK